MTLTQTTTPCCLGTFEGFKFIDSPMWTTLEVSLGNREALLVLPA